MPGSTIGGTNPRRVRLQHEQTHTAHIESLTWMKAKGILDDIGIELEEGTDVEYARRLIAEHYNELRAEGLI